MVFVDGPLRITPPLDPAAMAGKVVSRANFWSNLQRGLAPLQTQRIDMQTRETLSGSQQGTFRVRERYGDMSWDGDYRGAVSGSRHTSTTVTRPDYDAQNRSYAAADARERSANSRAVAMMDGSLKPTTLLAGTEIFGKLYFKRERKDRHGILVVPVGPNQYEFPITWK
jgi:hypothetical protein